MEEMIHRILHRLLQCVRKALTWAGERKVTISINAELLPSLSTEHEIRHVIMSTDAGEDMLRPSSFQCNKSASWWVKFSYIVTLTPSRFFPCSILCLYRSVIWNCYLVRNIYKSFKFLMWLWSFVKNRLLQYHKNIIWSEERDFNKLWWKMHLHQLCPAYLPTPHK